MKTKITIGTRSSKLAIWQTNHIKSELLKLYPNLEIKLKEIKTKGDHIQDISLSKIGGKGLFTKEIEERLLKGEIDLAVHSLKDLPTKLPPGLKIGVILKREKLHDVLIMKQEARSKKQERFGFKDLPQGSKVGTTSLRRIAQLKAIRDNLEYLDLRGNLDTRIKKLQEGKYDAIVVAYAGVKRLNMEHLISEEFDPKEFLPAVGQGAMAIELRENDKYTEEIISKLNDIETFLCTTCERSFLETLQGGCQVPIGAYSEIIDSKITLYGMIASLDGKRIIKDKIESNLEISTSKEIGIKLAHRLLQNGGQEILREINIETLRRSASISV